MALELEGITAALGAAGLLHDIQADKKLEKLLDDQTKAIEKSNDPSPAPVIKGPPVRMWDRPQAYNALSDHAVDCRQFNAVFVQIEVNATSPSADITLEGSNEQGGIYVQLPDPNATQIGVAANKAFRCMVASAWLRVRIGNKSGTYAAGQGFTIICTPYVSAGEHIEVKTKTVSTTLTRPSDTTQYSAGDQVANSTSAPTAIEFASAARFAGGGGMVVDAVCIDSANQATKPNLRLYLYDESVTPNNDNAAWAPSDADENKSIGYIEFTVWEIGTSTAGAGGNCKSFVKGVNIGYNCASSSTSIYGVLVERGTYTPVSAEAFKFRLKVAMD